MSSSTQSPTCLVEGRAAGKPASAFWRVVMGITGISLFWGLGRLFARFVLGRKATGRVRLEDGRLTLEEGAQMAGREAGKAKQTFSRAELVSARLETRFPGLPVLVGMLGLGLGVVMGIIWMLDGIQGEFTPWIVGGVGALMAGIVIDLVLSSLAASMPGRSTLTLYLPGNRILRLIGCDAEQAEILVRWLHENA